jgi:hypothetical protein
VILPPFPGRHIPWFLARELRAGGRELLPGGRELLPGGRELLPGGRDSRARPAGRDPYLAGY